MTPGCMMVLLFVDLGMLLQCSGIGWCLVQRVVYDVLVVRGDLKVVARF